MMRQEDAAGLTEAERKSLLSEARYGSITVHDLLPFVECLIAARESAAADRARAEVEGRVLAVLNTSSHSDGCEWCMTTGEWDCVCPLESLRAAVSSSSPAPSEDRSDKFYLGVGIDQRRCAACAAAPTLPCADHKDSPPCTGAGDCSAGLHEHGCHADRDGTACNDPGDHEDRAGQSAGRPEAVIKAEALREAAALIPSSATLPWLHERESCDWWGTKTVSSWLRDLADALTTGGDQ